MRQAVPLELVQVHHGPTLRAVHALVLESPDGSLHTPLIVLGDWSAAEAQVLDHLHSIEPQ
jgi:hypothetical protein